MRTCTVCAVPNVKQLNKDLAALLPERAIASKYNVTRSSVYRHRTGCAGRVISRMRTKREDTLTDQLHDLREYVEEIMENEADADIRLKAVGMRHKQIELEAKLAGEFTENRPNPLTLEERAAKFDELMARAQRKLIEGAVEATTAVN